MTRWSKLTYNEFGYCVIPDTHLSLYVRYCYTDGAYRISRFKDGEKRRNKLFIDGCLIRKIKPEITALELLYNLVHRVHYCYDNSDGMLSNSLILDKVAAVMEYDVNAMEFKSLDAGKVTTSPGYCTQNNITRLSHSRKALMMENYKSISEWYDTTKSVVENFNYAMSNNIEISERTLRRYCHFNDLPLSPKRIEPSEWYDRDMSVKSNMKFAA